MDPTFRTYLGIVPNVVRPWAQREKNCPRTVRHPTPTYLAGSFTPKSERSGPLRSKIFFFFAETRRQGERGRWIGRSVTLKHKPHTNDALTQVESLNCRIKPTAGLYEASKEVLQPEWLLCHRLLAVAKLNDLPMKSDELYVVHRHHHLCFPR